MILEFLKKKYLFIVPFIVLLVYFIIIALLTGESYLAVHDSPLFLTKSETNNGLFQIWSDNNFGSTQYLAVTIGLTARLFSYILIEIGIPTKWMQITFYILMNTIILYSSWYFFHKILRLLKYNATIIPSLIGSVFYSCNLYTIAFWHGGNIDATFLVFSISPILLYLIMLSYINGVDLKKLMLIVICIFVTINTGPYAIAVYVALFTPWILLSFNKRINHKNIFELFVFGVFTILVSLVFLIPIAYQVLQNDPFSTSTGLTSYAFSDHGISGIFRLFLEWTIDEAWSGRYFHSYYPYFRSEVAIFSIYALWIISFTSLLLVSIKRKWLQIFLLLTLVISIFISKSNQAPFGVINEFLYQYIPLFGIFRTPDTKFGLPIILILSFLISYSYLILKNKYVKIFIIICVTLQTWIFFTAIPILEIKQGDSYQRIVKIPNEYKQIVDIVNADKSEGRILFYPGLSYANYDFMNGYGITGQDILGKMIDRPKLYKDGFIMNKSADKYVEVTEKLDPKTLGQLSIRYLLLRNDIDKLNTSSIAATLSRSGDMEKILSNNVGTLYKIPGNYYQDYIQVLSSDKKIVDIHVQKLSSTNYQIILSSIPTDSYTLNFNSSYHPDWKLTSLGRINVVTHSLYNEFGNTWKFDIDSDDSHQQVLELQYQPQKILFYTGLISIFFLVIALGIIYETSRTVQK